ncbi:MAG: sugar phosphate isomerase/epimerase [Candidatus Omnitrophica bacterium]|nr:sugar phosphate isomerase/epimerase [Candidatus Omnitrophota bacterium]
MMRFSFMSFSCPEANLVEMLEYARKYGYDGVEPRSQAQHNHGIELDASNKKREEIKRTFEDSGIECACLATSLRYCFVSPVKRKESIETTKAFIDLAVAIGTKRIRVFGGIPDNEISVNDAVKIVGECLGTVAEYAEKNKIFLCLETHDFFSRADIAAQAVKIADSPYIRINWDIMHPYTKGMAIKEAFDCVKDLVEHCHIHDGVYDAERNVKLTLMGEGEIPYKEALNLLEQMNYQGYLSGEYIKAWEPDVVLPHDIKIMKTYLSR